MVISRSDGWLGRRVAEFSFQILNSVLRWMLEERKSKRYGQPTGI
jgi:hypothetical protein